MREFACRILLDVPHAAGVRRIQAATRIPPSPLVKLAGFEDVEVCGYKGLGFASRFWVWGSPFCSVLLVFAGRQPFMSLPLLLSFVG